MTVEDWAEIRRLHRGGVAIKAIVRQLGVSRTYRGGSSAANADRTVFRATPTRRAIALIGNSSDRCSRRISAQSSTLITPSL